MKKKIVIIISCLLLLASVGAAALSCGDDNGEPTPEKITWRMATYSLDGTLQTKLLKEFADKVKVDSSGQLEITVFAGGSLYQMTEIFDAVSSGAVDLGFTGVTSYIGKAPNTASASTYTAVTAANLTQMVAMDTALSNELTPMVTEANNANVTHLLWGPLGSNDSFFKFPVNTMADLKGKKLGCTQGVAPVVQLLGATPVPMDIADFYLSAKTGLVDGWVLCPLENYPAMKFYEVAPYLVNFQFNSVMSVLMNQDSFDSLPANLQTVVKDAALAIQTKWVSEVEASDAGYINTLKTTPGVNVKVLTAEERKTWIDAAFVPVFGGMMKKYMSEDNQAQAKAIIARVQTTGK